MKKLSLGSAQFGLNYGVSNNSGKVSHTEVRKILELAKTAGIELIDTAISYGDSEKVLGVVGVKNFKLVSKLPKIPDDCQNINSWIQDQIKKSLTLLGVESLYGLLIHNPRDLLSNFGEDIIYVLKKLKSDGLVKKIGISIYDPMDYKKTSYLIEFDIVQAPLNIIDRRLVDSGLLSYLYSKNIEIHTRSVFLQGLLLLSKKNLPVYFNNWSRIWDKWSLELHKNKLDAIEACLLYPLSIPEIEHVIVGVSNADQFNEIISKSNSKKEQIDLSFMKSNDQMLINPNNWKIT